MKFRVGLFFVTAVCFVSVISSRIEPNKSLRNKMADVKTKWPECVGKVRLVLTSVVTSSCASLLNLLSNIEQPTINMFYFFQTFEEAKAAILAERPGLLVSDVIMLSFMTS